jgi:hypothetical protein
MKVQNTFELEVEEEKEGTVAEGIQRPRATRRRDRNL